MGWVSNRALPVLDEPAEPCCAPLDAGRLSVDDAGALARQLKVLADPARLRMLSILLDSEYGEACTCDLVGPLKLSQPTVTHHLQRLAEAGVVRGDRRGRWTYYSVDKDAIRAITDALRLSV
ncbi:MAG TPA: metalloregulator ArsR/SmtB family transcription factor [Nocardioidaceae bacterium]|nr:metalloregulator ArsR/SmtB family transcription factor [Nocardioidaceae bacterium]